jgi:hypothetical protein
MKKMFLLPEIEPFLAKGERKRKVYLKIKVFPQREERKISVFEQKIYLWNIV